jgi:hypothetical protein
LEIKTTFDGFILLINGFIWCWALTDYLVTNLDPLESYIFLGDPLSDEDNSFLSLCKGSLNFLGAGL